MKSKKGFLLGIPIAGMIVWIGMARTMKDWLMILLAIYGFMVTLLLIGNLKRIDRLKDARCDPRLVDRLEEELDTLRHAYFKMCSEYGTMEGRMQNSDQVIEFYSKKFKPSDGVEIDESNGQYRSKDGISRDDKDRLAYQWNQDDVPVKEIAERLHLSVQSVNAYINRGAKKQLSVNGKPVKYDLDDEGRVIRYIEDDDSKED